MDPAAAIALVTATAVLVAIPGPNVALVVGNTLAHGVRHGMATVFGIALGVAVQVSLVVAGLAALLDAASGLFQWLRWAGVLYLFWIGVLEWRRGGTALHPQPNAPASLGRLFGQGAFMALVNPKTLLFNAAFLPQFVGADADFAALATVGALYLGVFLCGDTLWVLVARAARGWLARAGRVRHRLTGALYLAAGAGLALARIDRA